MAMERAVRHGLMPFWHVVPEERSEGIGEHFL